MGRGVACLPRQSATSKHSVHFRVSDCPGCRRYVSAACVIMALCLGEILCDCVWQAERLCSANQT